MSDRHDQKEKNAEFRLSAMPVSGMRQSLPQQNKSQPKRPDYSSPYRALLDPMPLEAISHVFRLTIVVHPGFLGQGIGTALMRDLMDWAKQSPRVKKLELLVRATNERAIRLYSKLGFVVEGRFRNRVRLPDGELVDDIAMAWFPDR